MYLLILLINGSCGLKLIYVNLIYVFLNLKVRVAIDFMNL